MGIRFRIILFAAFLAAIAILLDKGNTVVGGVIRLIHSLEELHEAVNEPWISGILGLSHEIKLFDEKNSCASDKTKGEFYLNARKRQANTFCIRAKDGWIIENPRTDFICNDPNSKGEWRHNYPYGQSTGFNADKSVYCDLVWAIGDDNGSTAGYVQIYATTRMKDPYGPVYRISIAIVIFIGVVFLIAKLSSNNTKKDRGNEPVT